MHTRTRPSGCAAVLRGAAVAAAALMILTGCSGSGGSAVAQTVTSSVAAEDGATAGSAAPPSATTSPSTTAAVTASTTSLPKGLTEQDLAAGVLSATVRWKGSGTLRTVKGSTRAPGRGKVLKIRIQVEKGLQVDAQKFADFVLDTLNDDRSWTEDGTRRFARTDRAAQAFTTVTLASPQTSAQMCQPLQTYGKLSCRSGNRVVLTNYRWVKAIAAYKKDRTGYRHYLINHEVGHALGHGHEYCAGKGELAPVMMQQTKGLLGCRTNPWPHP